MEVHHITCHCTLTAHASHNTQLNALAHTHTPRHYSIHLLLICFRQPYRGVAMGATGAMPPPPKSTTRKNFKRINTDDVQKNNAIFAQLLLILLVHFCHFARNFSLRVITVHKLLCPLAFPKLKTCHTILTTPIGVKQSTIKERSQVKQNMQ